MSKYKLKPGIMNQLNHSDSIVYKSFTKDSFDKAFDNAIDKLKSSNGK